MSWPLSLTKQLESIKLPKIIQETTYRIGHVQSIRLKTVHEFHYSDIFEQILQFLAHASLQKAPIRDQNEKLLSLEVFRFLHHDKSINRYSDRYVDKLTKHLNQQKVPNNSLTLALIPLKTQWANLTSSNTFLCAKLSCTRISKSVINGG